MHRVQRVVAAPQANVYLALLINICIMELVIPLVLPTHIPLETPASFVTLHVSLAMRQGRAPA